MNKLELTALPRTPEITAHRFIAVTCAVEINLTGLLSLRGVPIACDAYIPRHGTRVQACFLRDGIIVESPSKRTGQRLEEIAGGVAWWETASDEDRSLVNKYLLCLRDLTALQEANQLPVISGSVVQTFYPYKLAAIPETLKARIMGLASRYCAALATEYDGKPNSERRSAARYNRYWIQMWNYERSIMQKIQPFIGDPGIAAESVVSDPHWRYQRPSEEEKRALQELHLSIVRHYLPPADFLEALDLLQQNEPELPQLPPSFNERVLEVLSCEGRWLDTQKMFTGASENYYSYGPLPAHAHVWPMILQDLVSAMLRLRIKAALHKRSLLWPPVELRRKSDDKRGSIAFDQVFLGVA